MIWLLVLRYLIFYFDDRRSLVWDPSAQRRLLRLLFLPTNETEPNRDLVSRILKQDSYYRNVSATLTRQEKEFKRQEQVASTRPQIEQQLDEQTRQLQKVSEQLRAAQNGFAGLHDRRATARLTALRAEQEVQAASANLEFIRLQQIRRLFPSQRESAEYWLTQLISEEDCIVCGSHAPELANELADRIMARHCVLCDSVLTEKNEAPESEELPAAEGRLRDANDALRSAAEDRRNIETEFNAVIAQLAELESAVSQASASVERLEAALPESSRKLTARQEALAQLRIENAALREQVLADKATYATLVQEQNLQIAKFQERVKDSFDHHAKDFLLESTVLVWGQTNEQVGQIGQPIAFSVFRVDMTGGAVAHATRRESADQVSESQREFIDIAFRMALIVVAGEEHAGTLIIDAPESSLDAVFAPRAARVLTQFGGSQGDSRVILTSNLVDGQLIPTIAALAGIDGPNDRRVVNLFDIAAPTAALRELRPDYDAALDRAFKATIKP